MMRSTSFVASDAQQSPALTLGDRSAVTGDSGSVSGSDEDNAGSDNAIEGSRKRKRSHVKISCELCKARKVKCDRNEPSCGWCFRNNRLCVYQDRKKPGLRVGYGRELEEKINRLDAIIQVLGRRVEDHISEHDSRSSQFQSPEFSVYQHVPRSVQAEALANTSSAPSWSRASNNGNRNHFSRPSDTMAIHSVVANATVGTIEGPDSLSPGQTWVTTPTSNTSELPPNDLLYSIADLYFKHINTWSPLLDHGAIMDKLFGSNTMAEEDRILAHAIVATTLRFSNDPRLTPQSRRLYHNNAKQRVVLYALSNPTVRALQSLLILALDVLGTSNGPEGASLLALMAQNIVHLGLGREKGVFLDSPACPSIGTAQAFVLPQPKSWIEDEERRRLFWMTYVLDRYATIDTAFDFALNEQEMDRALPCRYDQFSENVPVETKWFRWNERSETIINQPANLGSFSYHCEVLRILSRVHRFLKRPVNIDSTKDVQEWRETYQELGGELDSWLHHLPGEYGKISQLCHSDPASKVANWIMLHAAFVTATIRLHSSAAYPTIRSHLFTPSFNAAQKCLSAVESLREIAQDVVDTRGLNLLGPPFAFSLWVSARLLLVHAATMESEIDPKVRFFISTLEQMGQFWQVAQNYANILTHVIRQHEMSESPSEGVEPVETFTAMRKRAYDLNLLISQRPRTTLNPISRTPTSNELEYLEIFDFFSRPRLSSTMMENNPVVTASMPNSVDMGQVNGYRATSFAMPTPESDWLIFKPPYD